MNRWLDVSVDVSVDVDVDVIAPYTAPLIPHQYKHITRTGRLSQRIRKSAHQAIISKKHVKYTYAHAYHHIIEIIERSYH